MGISRLIESLQTAEKLLINHSNPELGILLLPTVPVPIPYPSISKAEILPRKVEGIHCAYGVV
jgi:hypothetical protein